MEAGLLIWVVIGIWAMVVVAILITARKKPKPPAEPKKLATRTGHHHSGCPESNGLGSCHHCRRPHF